MSVSAQAPALSSVAHLESLIGALPDDPRREKVLYHLGRLRQAFLASHQEAVRFAAFTVNKTIHDASAEWGEGITAAMDGLRAALHDAHHEF